MQSFEEDWNNEDARISEEARITQVSEYTFREKRKPTECYFVLWIEWVDGVAYRRACGAVATEAWEQIREKELVDLILG
jgi:hypothetical protein